MLFQTQKLFCCEKQEREIGNCLKFGTFFSHKITEDFEYKAHVHFHYVLYYLYCFVVFFCPC